MHSRQLLVYIGQLANIQTKSTFSTKYFRILKHIKKNHDNLRLLFFILYLILNIASSLFVILHKFKWYPALNFTKKSVLNGLLKGWERKMVTKKHTTTRLPSHRTIAKWGHHTSGWSEIQRARTHNSSLLDQKIALGRLILAVLLSIQLTITILDIESTA